LPFEHQRQRRLAHDHRAIAEVHLAWRRAEQHIHAGIAA
jgi:hypothetical protein